MHSFQSHTLIFKAVTTFDIMADVYHVSSNQCLVSSSSSGATALQGLGRESGRRRSAKLVPTFADRGVSRGQRNGSLFTETGSLLIFIQVAPQLTSRGSWGWVHPVPDPLPLRKSGSAGNRTRDLCICSQKPWPLDHRGGRLVSKNTFRVRNNLIFWEQTQALH